MLTNYDTDKSSPDDDRRDIAILGTESAWDLNRLAVRNRGADPFEVSGDAIATTRKSGDQR